MRIHLSSSVIRVGLLGALLVPGAGCALAPHEADREFDREPAEATRGRSEAGPEKPKGRAADEVAPGNEVILSCPEDPSLDGKYRIEFEGTLKLPYKVKIDTDGLTREGLQGRVVEAYSKFYKSAPSISVAIIADKIWVEAGGLVEKPGRFLIKGSSSLDEVIALAGGLQKATPPRYVRVQQGKRSTVISLTDYYAGAADAKVPGWEGGDVVFLQSDRGATTATADAEGFVQIVGEVHNPGEFRYVKGADFYHYLVKAGGPTTASDLGHVELVRGTGRGKVIARFSFSSPREIPTIQSGDLLVLMSDKPTPFEKAVPLAAGLVGILNTVLLLILLH
jgi:protein involved in polysaccharide export with SLBB domain